MNVKQLSWKKSRAFVGEDWKIAFTVSITTKANRFSAKLQIASFAVPTQFHGAFVYIVGEKHERKLNLILRCNKTIQFEINNLNKSIFTFETKAADIFMEFFSALLFWDSCWCCAICFDKFSSVEQFDVTARWCSYLSPNITATVSLEI